MAAFNVKGVVATAVAAGGVSNKVLSGLIDGRVKVMVDSYVPDGTEGVGSTIKFGALIPTGANILAACLVAIDNTAATGDLGDSNDPDRYLNDANLATGGAGPLVLSTGQNYVIGTNSGDNQILLTTAGATLTSGKTIKVAIFYSID